MIESIRIIKKSNAWKEGAFGFALGALAGIPLGGFIEGLGETGLSAGELISIMAVCEAVLAIPGALIGAISGTDKTVQIKGKSPEEIQRVLAELRPQARIPHFQ
ncbi:MAG TPA: hypothetical protein VMW46_04065 [Candidatus Desulfaltia sp.]|nr:hypothetical protein [Candidatus Desulfaltia sp.]